MSDPGSEVSSPDSHVSSQLGCFASSGRNWTVVHQRKRCGVCVLIPYFAFALCGSHDKRGGSGWKVIVLVIRTGHVCISLRGELI